MFLPLFRHNKNMFNTLISAMEKTLTVIGNNMNASVNKLTKAVANQVSLIILIIKILDLNLMMIKAIRQVCKNLKEPVLQNV